MLRNTSPETWCRTWHFLALGNAWQVHFLWFPIKAWYLSPTHPCWGWMQVEWEAPSGTQTLGHLLETSKVALISPMKRTSWKLMFMYFYAQLICFALCFLLRLGLVVSLRILHWVLLDKGAMPALLNMAALVLLIPFITYFSDVTLGYISTCTFILPWFCTRVFHTPLQSSCITIKLLN